MQRDDDPRARAAAAMRRFGHALIGHDADRELLERVAAQADRAAADLERQPPRQRDLVELKRRMFNVSAPDGQPISHFDECFVSGPWNPMGIAVEVVREGEEAVAHVELGPAFEGAPGRSHGGIVAAIFDDVLGYLQTFHHQPAFTGELTVRYLAPTPIRQPLEFRGRITSFEGRKIHTAAEAYALGGDGSRGDPVAAATAVFIVVDIDRFRA
jgi:acyl-coenzyme A thioesterase PaaI-like protein